MRTFEVKTPDGRHIRHLAASPDDAKKGLVFGYEVVGEVLGAKPDGSGGVVSSMTGERTLMGDLLDRHGDELLAWLASSGIVPAVRILSEK